MTDHTDRYLWDGSGDADPLIADLERALAPLRVAPAPPPLPLPTPTPTPTPVPAPSPAPRRWVPWAAALAACLLLAFFAVRLAGPARGGWSVALGTAGATARPRGSEVLTPEDARAVITDPARPGVSIIVAPGSRLRLGSPADAPASVDLDAGEVSASAGDRPMTVRAGPGQFEILAGSAALVSARPGRPPEITVTRGQARARTSAREVRLAAGFTAALSAKGPTIPVRAAASDGFRFTVAMLDHDRARGKAAGALASMGDPADAATLWNAARVLDAGEREPILARLAELVPPPDDWPKEKTLGLHPAAMDAWWDKITR
jgi:hypothetical protein